MGWIEQPGGTLQKEMDGVLLELDPVCRRLRIVVTDYHARPVELDLSELQGAAVPQSDRPQPSRVNSEPSGALVPACVERHVPAPVAGAAVVVLALVLYCGGRSDGQE